MHPSLKTFRTEVLQPRLLAGMRLRMSFTENTTALLWKKFMQGRGEITNPKGTELYSVQLYPPDFFDRFDPSTPFEKWAAVEIGQETKLPEGMECLELPGGLHAVFLYKGSSANAPEVFQYIFGVWFPGSAYVPDHRPHFEILGEAYRNNDPESEEQIWIPIRLKA